jgi:heme exporter protein C
MFVMALSFWMYTIAIVLSRLRNVILERERHSAWVTELVEGRK